MALYYPRPNTTGWTVKNIPVGGGDLNLTNGVDYILQAPTSGGQLVPITGYVNINGGRNICWIGGIIGGRTSVPNLTTNYDKSNKGIRLSDGSDVRSVYIEGIWYKPGTYLSDAFQTNIRTNNGVSLTLQNFRVDANTYGNQGTPGFHSDQIQCYGGPLNFKLNGWTGKNAYYQGFYLDPGDGRTLPTGSGKVPWEFRNVNIEGNAGLGGARYLYANREPAWTGAQLTNFYTTASTRNPKDSFGNAPSSLIIGSHTDFVPVSLWAGNVYDEAGAGGGGTPGTGTYNISASDSLSLTQTSVASIGGSLLFKSAVDSIRLTVSDNSALNTGSAGSSGSVSVNTQLWPK
jgi:hypothetical protein